MTDQTCNDAVLADNDALDLSATRRAVTSLPDLLCRLHASGRDSDNVSDKKLDPSAALTAADAAAIFDPPSEEEQALVTALRHSWRNGMSDIDSDCEPLTVDPFYFIAALYARKGDITRSAALLRNYLAWRKRIGADVCHPANNSKLREQLRSGLIVSPGTRDRLGRAVVYMRLRLNEPDRFSALDTIRLSSVVLEWTLRTYPYAKSHGIAFYQDMRDLRFRNMDLRVPREMRNAFAQTLPIRCGSMNVLNPPVFLRLIFSIVNKLFSDKMKTRVNVIVKQDSLLHGIESSQIPQDTNLGGTLQWTENALASWCDQVESDFQTWAQQREQQTEQFAA